MPIQGLEHYTPRKWLSISSLVAVSRCPRRYFYSSGCRLVPGEGEHVALKFGEAIHAALPWILAHNDLAKAYSEFMRIWGTTLGDEKRNPTNAKIMLASYQASHRPGSCLFTIKEPPRGDIEISDRVSAWEIPWALDIGLNVPLVGRIDGLCTHRDTKEPFGLEFKTSSEMSARVVTGFEMNTQITGYTLALRTYTGEPVAGIMLDLVGVQKKGPSEMTYPLRVLNHQLEAFLRWARRWGSYILECEKIGEFDYDYTGCTPYQAFGTPGYMCEYKVLCQTEDWTKFRGFFKQRDDRPFDIGACKAVPVPEKAKLEGVGV